MHCIPPHNQVLHRARPFPPPCGPRVPVSFTPGPSSRTAAAARVSRDTRSYIKGRSNIQVERTLWLPPPDRR